MNNSINQGRIDEVLAGYSHLGKVANVQTHGNGHINNTFLVEFEDKSERMILQEINTSIFKNPKELMENILGVTQYLRNKIIERGGDPNRETLNVILTDSGESLFVDSQGGAWRAYLFVEDASSYDLVEDKKDFYESGFAFGQFQGLLSEYPAHTLYETIPHFHDTAKRFETFKAAVEADVAGRKKDVEEEINFVLAREKDAKVFGELLAEGKIPLRVTHNDTKLNNIMLDNKTRKGICVVDLDTVMPGLAMHDFGDSIRFGANTALEDEKDLSKVSCSLDLFEAYATGFLEGCDGRLTPLEVELLPFGAKIMTYECGMRFLTDYLQGDTYFKTAYPEHNLVRARNQFKLVSDMESKMKDLEGIIAKLS